MLRVDGTLNLDGLAGDEIIDIEIIDIVGDTPNDDNTLILDQQDVLDISSTSNQLYVFGDSGDTLDIDTLGNWTLTDTDFQGQGFQVYTNGAATLIVDPDITVI